MPYPGRYLPTLLLLFTLVFAEGYAADGTDSASAPTLDREQIETLIGKLEDSTQREQLIDALRALSEVSAPGDTPAKVQGASVKTAVADALNRLATRVAQVAESADALLVRLQALPTLAVEWAGTFRSPEIRSRWLRIALRLALVLGSGFVAAALLAWLISQVRGRARDTDRPGLSTRILRLFGRMLVDLAPVLLFAVVSYAALALTAAERETRLVAVALINASILSRLLLALSAFLVSPGASQLRLWRISDETAYYIHHWVKRLAFIALYGFFGLQAALLLGLDKDSYQLLLYLLGALIVGLLLVLIAQNRDDVAAAIAAEPLPQSDELRQLMPLRRAIARVWHLLAGLYLLLVYAIWAMQIEEGARFVLQATVVTLAVSAVSLLLFRAIDRLFDRGLRLSDELHQGFPGLEQRLNRYFPVMRKVFKAALAVLSGLLIADAWSIDALEWVISGSGRVLLGAALNILLIVAVAIVVWELASGSIQRYLTGDGPEGSGHGRSPRVRTLLTVGRNALLVVLTLVSTLMVLSELGINITPLLAGAGVMGLAIGFGAQRLVQDVINGAFILFQDLMAVGDVVKLGDKAGVVEALSIRTVRLRDLAGVVHTIPFSSIEAVSNLTREFSFHVFDIGIAYREDVDSVIALIRQIGEELRADPEIGPLVLEPLEVFGLDAFGDSAIVIKGRIKTQPIKQWQVGRAFNRLVKMRFDEHGIEIPFPHRTLYFGQDKDGSAPPAFVQVESLLRETSGG